MTIHEPTESVNKFNVGEYWGSAERRIFVRDSRCKQRYAISGIMRAVVQIGANKLVHLHIPMVHLKLSAIMSSPRIHIVADSEIISACIHKEVQTYNPDKSAIVRERPSKALYSPPS
jgi:hypothetical protein